MLSALSYSYHAFLIFISKLFCALCIHKYLPHIIFCHYSLVFHIVFIFCSHFLVTINLHKTRTLDEFFHNSPGAPCGTWALLILGDAL